MKTKTIGYRLTEKEVEILNEIAISLNFFYGGKPCFTKVLRGIAKGNLIISQKIT